MFVATAHLRSIRVPQHGTRVSQDTSNRSLHLFASTTSWTYFNCFATASFISAISVLFLIIARIVSSFTRATFSCCSRYLRGREVSVARRCTDEQRTQSRRPEDGTWRQHHVPWRPSLLEPSFAPILRLEYCSQQLLAVQPGRPSVNCVY